MCSTALALYLLIQTLQQKWREHFSLETQCFEENIYVNDIFDGVNDIGLVRKKAGANRDSGCRKCTIRHVSGK